MRARGEVGLAVLLLASPLALILLSSPLDSRSDVRVLDIGDGDADLELLPLLDGAAGPESIVFSDDGENDGGGPFTGVSDGRVLRWVPAQRRWEEHASSTAPELKDSCRGSTDPAREHECGRPLGLKFNPATGELYVADAYHGLRVVPPPNPNAAANANNNNDNPVPSSPSSSTSRPVAPEWWQGTRPFSFANGVEVDPLTGAVYYTETSTRFHRRDFLRIVVSGDSSGRLLRYDPKINEVEVLADGLAFSNGLAMSRDGSHLLLAETTTGRILRYWLRPPPPESKTTKVPAAAAEMEEVARLPWFPDNVGLSPRGGIWVGLHARRGRLAELCITYPWLRRMLLAAPPRHVQRASWVLDRLAGGGRQVIAVRIGEEDGKVVEMVSVSGKELQRTFRSVSEVVERNGSLWIGSVMAPVLGVYRLQ